MSKKKKVRKIKRAKENEKLKEKDDNGECT